MFSPTVWKMIRMAGSTPDQLIRRIIVAILTGNLPDEYRADAATLLTDALHYAEDDIRSLVILGLSELDVEPEIILPALTGAIHDSNEGVRKRAIRTLGDMGSRASLAMSHLISALTDSSMSVVLEAMNTIGRIGKRAETAIPSLVRLLGHENTRVRIVAGNVLKQIGDAAIPALNKALADKDALRSERAAAVLWRLGKLEESEYEQYFQVEETQPERSLLECMN